LRNHVDNMKIRVEHKAGNNAYNVVINNGLIRNIGGIISKNKSGEKVFIVTNRKVKRLWYAPLKRSLEKSGIEPRLITIGDGEQYKNLHTYKNIISKLITLKANRYSTLVGFGGGVIGDLTGFVASNYMRGINLIHIPTTLIAQIDSSIGGKTAIDTEQAKNMIGSFYNPKMVLTDPDILRTLSERDFLNGLFEAIKIALVSNKGLYKYMANNMASIIKRRKNILEELITRCAGEKIKIIRKDPFDKGLRMILNFGHTFGHALETLGGYKSLTHGEAVGWGMLLAIRLSTMLGLGGNNKSNQSFKIISNMLAGRKLKNLDSKSLWKTISLDKKTKNRQVRFILLKDIGYPVLRNIDRKLFTKALETL